MNDIDIIDEIVDGYVTCALWSSLDDDGSPLDDWADVDDITPMSLAAMRADVIGFLRANQEDADAYRVFRDWECFGHDFWLTRNHHGAGFWDRGLGDLGQRLTDAAHVYGSVDLYIGDDGKVYGQ